MKGRLLKFAILWAIRIGSSRWRYWALLISVHDGVGGKPDSGFLRGNVDGLLIVVWGHRCVLFPHRATACHSAATACYFSSHSPWLVLCSPHGGSWPGLCLSQERSGPPGASAGRCSAVSCWPYSCCCFCVCTDSVKLEWVRHYAYAAYICVHSNSVMDLIFHVIICLSSVFLSLPQFDWAVEFILHICHSQFPRKRIVQPTWNLKVWKLRNP